MVRCRFDGVNHYHEGERLEKGDEVELTESQYEAFERKFIRLGDDSSESDSEGSEEDSDEEQADSSEGDEGSPEEAESRPDEIESLLDENVNEIQSQLEGGDYDEYLDQIEQAESEGKGRKTVLSAIEERREE